MKFAALKHLSLASILCLCWHGEGWANVPRPPQFVAMAFDNCTEVERWRELDNFVSRLNAQHKPIAFTFFLSGVAMLATSKRQLYKGPHHPAGSSNINFGGKPEDVAERIRLVRALQAQNSEIASHAVGHFDATEHPAWTAADWQQEFDTYQRLLTNVHSNNDLAADQPLTLSFQGFRAPYLETTPPLFPVLRRNGFRYDTSGTNEPTAWPRKIDGIWRFDLAVLTIHGTSTKTLSMDYNFFKKQSNAVDDPANAARYREQMLRTYIEYFRRNYAGNRAPLHIGHHFQAYQCDVYNDALKRFAEIVCGLDEVKCVTYSKLADFMEQASDSTRAAYQRGETKTIVAVARNGAGTEIARRSVSVTRSAKGVMMDLPHAELKVGRMPQ